MRDETTSSGFVMLDRMCKNDKTWHIYILLREELYVYIYIPEEL